MDVSTVKPVATIPTIRTSGAFRAISRNVNARVAKAPSSQIEQDLLGDCFATTYNAEPTLRNEVPPERALNAELMKWAMENNDFMSGRAASIGNIPVALSTASLLYSGLQSDEALNEARQKQEEASYMEELAKDMAKKSMQEAAAGNTEAAKQAMEKSEQWEQAAKVAAQQAVEEVEKLKGDIFGQQVMNTAVQKANEEGQKVAEVMKGWGVGAGDIAASDVDEIINLAQNTQALANRIAQLAGRLKDVASRSIAKVKQSDIGPNTEVAVTKNPMRIFPTELIYAFSGKVPMAIKSQRLARFVQNGLIGWRPKAEGKQAGAFVVMADSSGSMRGDNDVAAKAISLGLARAVNEDEERYYELHQFATEHSGLLSHRKGDGWKSEIEWASKGIYGGTDFDFALNRSMDFLEAMAEKDRADADLFFITDGLAGIESETIERWHEIEMKTGVRMFLIVLGSYTNHELEDIASVYIQVDDPMRGLMSQAEEIVEKIATGIALHSIA